MIDFKEYIEKVKLMLEEKEIDKNKKKKISLFEYLVVAAMLTMFGVIPLVLWLVGVI